MAIYLSVLCQGDSLRMGHKTELGHSIYPKTLMDIGKHTSEGIEKPIQEVTETQKETRAYSGGL